MKKLSVSSAFDLFCNVVVFIADLIWKLWITALAGMILMFITLAISAYFADEDFQKLNVQYTDAMVPAMNDQIDHYFIQVAPWVLVVFLVLLILYKRAYENER